MEGSFRFRAILPQIQNEATPSFWLQGRLHIKGNFYPNNNLKMQAHFLSANPYGQTLSLKDSFKIYPSMNWLFNDYLELKLGRNIYTNKFPQIVSLNDHEPFFHAFDGVFLEYSTQIINVNFWGASLPKRWVSDKQIQDFKYGFGFFLDIRSVSDHIDYFNAHVAYLGDSFLEGGSQMSRYGFGLEGMINLIDLAYTFVAIGHGPGIQFKLEESMYHFRLSYSYPEFFDSKIFAGYHTDSSKYNPWFYDRHKNAGLADIFLWGNLTYYFLGLSSSISPLLNIQILFYNLSSTAKGPVQTGYFGSLLKPKTADFLNVEHKALGRELDIQLKTKINPSFEIHLLAGLFIPHSVSRNIWADWTEDEGFYNNLQLAGLYRF